MGDPLPEHPRDAEIELTERVATRLFRWTNWYIKILGFFAVMLLAILGFFGFKSFKDYKDFEDSINEFNRDVKPKILQAREDAAAADVQVKKTTTEANNQLQAVKKFNNTISELQTEAKKSSDAIVELQREIQKLKNSLQPSPNTVGTSPPQSAPQTPQKCEPEVGVVSGYGGRQPQNYFNFPEQRLGTSSERISLGAYCGGPRLSESQSRLRFTLTGPFYFDEGGQVLERTITNNSTHFSILFRPSTVGPASGTFTIFSPEGLKIKERGFTNPATLSGAGKE